MQLDSIDKRILETLQKQGRLSNQDLSERVGLSPSASHRRVQRLEEEGFIAGYVALLDPKRLGRRTLVFVEITLQGQADEVLDAFEKAVARIPEVLEEINSTLSELKVARQSLRHKATPKLEERVRVLKERHVKLVDELSHLEQIRNRSQ